MQDSTFWNSDESIERYASMEDQLYDIEAAYLLKSFSNLKKNVDAIKLLDIGCGGGRTSIPLHSIGCDVTAVDIAPELIQQLKLKAPKVKAYTGDAKKLSFTNSSFDVVLFSHNSIDYLVPEENRDRAFSEVHRVLKQGGYFIFSSHVFNFLPYSLGVLKNIVLNMPIVPKYLNDRHVYFNEYMENGQSVKTFAATHSYLKEEIEKNGFSYISSSRIIQHNPSLFMTCVRSLLNWEQYYYVQKR